MIILPDVDLSTAMVGSSGTILLQNMGVGGGGVSANPTVLKNLPTLFMHNESGCGLSIILKDSQKSFNIAAGQWVPIAIGPGESAVIWKVKYILPNAPVNLLMTTYYFPGEPIPNIAVLGNSPIGIGGSTSNVTNTSLSNEGNAINTLVEDIGTPTTAQLLQIWNDHFSWRVEQSGVAHQVLKGQTSGSPLLIGQAGDISHVLGQLLIDQIPSSPATSPPTGTGSITVYELVVGSLKIVVVNNVNLQNTSASKFSIALPTAFTSAAVFLAGDITGTELLASGTAQSCDVVTTTNAGTGSTTSPQNTIFSENLGGCSNGFDTLRFQGNNSVSHTSVLILIGV